MKMRLFFLVILMAALLSSCSQSHTSDMQDGYYTAEAASFDSYGWKEFITIYVSNNKIVTVEYDAKNPSGFIKSWDMDYMRKMNVSCGTYPNEYVRAYAAGLLSKGNPSEIDAVSGATYSYTSFELLAKSVILQAKSGDKNVVLVDLPVAE